MPRMSTHDFHLSERGTTEASPNGANLRVRDDAFKFYGKKSLLPMLKAG